MISANDRYFGDEYTYEDTYELNYSSRITCNDKDA